jgi:hypothetical protein
MAFKKGNIYIIHSETMGHWYMVKQTGMKTWVAMNFTNIDIANDKEVFSGNGQALWAKLQPRNDWKRYFTNKLFRQGMYDILSYGYFK